MWITRRTTANLVVQQILMDAECGLDVPFYYAPCIQRSQTASFMTFKIKTDVRAQISAAINPPHPSEQRTGFLVLAIQIRGAGNLRNVILNVNEPHRTWYSY